MKTSETQLLLFFLVNATNALHSEAVSPYSAKLEGPQCVSEARNCAVGTECLECISPTTQEKLDAFLDCVAGMSTARSSPFSCASRSVPACCLDAVSANDCLGNDFFVAYKLCSVSGSIFGDITIAGVEVEQCQAFDCSAADDSGEGLVGDADGGADEREGGAGDDVDKEVDEVGGVIPSSVTDELCLDELHACYDDEECGGCIHAQSNSAADDEWVECWAHYSLYDGSEEVCTLLSGEVCCSDVVSANDCVGNAAFVAYNVCFYSQLSMSEGQGECSSIVTCSAGQAAAGDGETGGAILSA